MTKTKRLLIFISFLFLTACENKPEVIVGSLLINNEGINYHLETSQAFTGRAEWFYDNGQLKTYINFVDGKRNGLNEDFYEDGKLAERSSYIDGKRNGLHEEYYQNGRLMERRHYVYGKGNGLWERFSEEGTMVSSKYYKNGSETGN